MAKVKDAEQGSGFSGEWDSSRYTGHRKVNQKLLFCLYHSSILKPNTPSQQAATKQLVRIE
jgi:hypothetical protein